jgi:hypothetical protein
LLFTAAVSLGAFAIHQKNQLAQLQTQLADAQNRLKADSEAEEKIADAENRTKVLHEALEETSKFADEKAKEAEKLQQSLAAAKKKDTNPFGEMAKMMKDPAMKEMIKAQQKATIGSVIDKQYAEFFQQMNLTPEQSATMKELLEKKMLAGSDAGMSMMDGSLDAAQRAELSKQVKSAKDDADAQIKQFLGDENYKTFQDYEKTSPYRTAVGQFSDQLAGSATPLSEDQQAQLIQAMSDEQSGFKFTTNFGNKNPANGDYAARINQYAMEKEKLDQRVLARAQQVLTREQVEAFQKYQTTQRTLQMAGMKMGAKMLTPKSE